MRCKKCNTRCITRNRAMSVFARPMFTHTCPSCGLIVVHNPGNSKATPILDKIDNLIKESNENDRCDVVRYQKSPGTY